MTTTDLWSSISALAKAEDIPLIGTGPCEAMAREPPGSRPADVLPGARGVVCFGLPVPRGVYEAPAHSVEMIWRSQNLHYRRLDSLSLRIAQVLESAGERAVPVFGCCPMSINRRREVSGYVNLIAMGALVGIGSVGRNALLVHPRHGARLMLGGVLTTAELPSHSTEEDALPQCPPGCRVCIDACPAGALIEGKHPVRVMRCLSYTARTPLMSRLRFGMLTAINREAAALYMNQRGFDEHTMHVCSRCISQCPLGVL